MLGKLTWLSSGEVKILAVTGGEKNIVSLPVIRVKEQERTMNKWENIGREQPSRLYN